MKRVKKHKAQGMSTESQDIGNFRNLVGTWKAAYRWAVCSYLVVKTDEGAKLLVGRIVFEPSIVAGGAKSIRVETERLIGGRQVLKITPDKLNAIVSDAVQAKIRVSGKTFSLPGQVSGAIFFPLFPFYYPAITFDPRIPGLLIRGGPKDNLLSAPNYKPYQQLDWSLKASDQPFDSLEELLTYLGLPSIMQMGDSTVVELFARSPAMILDTSQISKGVAIVNCRAASSLGVGKISLGYKLQDKSSLRRSLVKARRFKWHMKGDLRDGSVRIRVGNVPLFRVFLNYDGVALHQWWVFDPQKQLNPRHAIYEEFDRNLDVLKKYLSGESSSRDSNFEHGIAHLLHMLGLSVIQQGLTKPLEEGPDLLALTPAGNVAVIECTIGLLNQKDKLAKLVRRTTLIRKKLGTTGHSHILVQPVIVSALTRTEVQAHLAEAGRNGIAVVCKEELDGLINEVKFPANPEGLFQRAIQLIPPEQLSH